MKITNLSAVNLVTEFAQRGPWITSMGGRAAAIIESLVIDMSNSFLERFPKARTILELGSLEGGHAFTLARPKASNECSPSKGALPTLKGEIHWVIARHFKCRIQTGQLGGT